MDADRKIPAVKVFVSQLNRARQQSEAVGTNGDVTNVMSLSLGGVEFTRVWIQGVVVEVDTVLKTMVVDDGSGTVTAVVPGFDLDGRPNNEEIGAGDGDGSGDVLPKKGQHVLLVGAVTDPPAHQQRRSELQTSCHRYLLLCDVFKDLGSESPNRDTLWVLEVADFWRNRPRSS
ncbi:unnamed protein product [Scytosiphon promiscuus]